jgi:hypothetical protein
VLADYLATATQIKHPGVHLHRLARCAGRIDDPDPALATAARPWAGHDDDRAASAVIGALARLRDPGCLELARRAVARRELRGPDLDDVCEIYGESAVAFLRYLREQRLRQTHPCRYTPTRRGVATARSRARPPRAPRTLELSHPLN